MKNKKDLPLRKGVGIVLLNQQNKVFVGKRIDNANNFWQMPQGGVDNEESYLDAAKRELLEETGIKTIEIIKEVQEWLSYNLPENLLGKNRKYQKEYREQNPQKVKEWRKEYY